MREVEEMTLREYLLRMHAYRLKRIDENRNIHLQAWLNFLATSTKEKGSKQVPVYPKFEDFFDYEKELKEVEGVKKNPRNLRLANLAASVNG
ncbi:MULTISPECIES: hypothetical protein [Bhargavaea]|uniref:Phage integrase, N-terminal SAM-like domain n=1 Tax=Bhargavaea changchunensis TaxID=2134037 RepID=A0ABW2NEP6_9BACL|nr:hypothetical protein [Bhargavaea sp. CC-171006]